MHSPNKPETFFYDKKIMYVSIGSICKEYRFNCYFILFP